MEYTTSTAIIMLILLVATVALGFFTGVNTGIIGFGVAFLAGTFLVGMKGKNIAAGWPTDLGVQLIGVMLLFSVASVNKTMEKLATLIVGLAKGQAKLVPFLFFILGALLSFAGPGPISMVAVLAPLCMPVGKKAGLSDLLTACSVVFGCLAGGLAAHTAVGSVAYSLGVSNEVIVDTAGYQPVFLACLVTYAICFLFYYIILGGWKLPTVKEEGEKEKVTFDKAQIETLIVILVVIVLIFWKRYHTGLITALGAAILLALKAADQKKVIAGVNWNTIILIGGMSCLINVVSAGGGIQLLADTLSKIMNEVTATPIMIALGGIMSSVSSATGVVLPTLIPTIPTIVASTGLGANGLYAGAIIGAFGVTLSPLSTLGALSLGASNADTDKDKLFTQLLIVGFGSVLFCAVLAFLGLYRLF